MSATPLWNLKSDPWSLLVIVTYQDILDRIGDWIGQNPGAGAVRDQRRAILDAYREIAYMRQWTYFWKQGRLFLQAAYSTGTVTYVHSTRILTLVGGTFPTWAAQGTVTIAGIQYKVTTRTDGTHLVLDSTLNPGANIASATDYQIALEAYDLPADFRATTELERDLSGVSVRYIRPQDWLDYVRRLPEVGTPIVYTIVASPNTPGRLAVRFAPFPTAATTFDFLYQARPRALDVGTYETGKASVTSTAVTGTGTAWTSAMQGCVMRFSDDPTNAPTDMAGNKVATHESRIASVTNATALVLETAAASALTTVKYRISDPIDVEEGAMMNAFFRCVEKMVSLGRPLADRQAAAGAYREALMIAKEADARWIGDRFAGGYPPPYVKGTILADDV